MAGVWKRNGTIAVTKGSKKVVGTGTTFADPKNAAAKGHLLVMVTGTAVDLYEVDYSESNSVFYLVEAYRGDTVTGKAYAIDTSRTDSIPEFARRLNATLGAYQQQSDAFQALLTSDAATIEVTAPDGTKHTMIPWKRVTSEGEGQAARAKVEADKATAAAALAVNVVREASLPFPDVWAPLSDSLRLLAGYGREVKVGDDVVGRYMNFERATAAWYFDKTGVLKQAAINEPRFEKAGLLIEGPSTNNILYSDFIDNGNWYTNNAENSAVSAFIDLPAFGPRFPLCKLTATTTALASRYLWVRGGTPITAGATVTISAWVFRPVGSRWNQVRIGSNNLSPATTTHEIPEGEAIRITHTAPLTTGNAVVVYVQPQVNGQNAPTTEIGEVLLIAGCMQIEAAPNASSYIPTAGAAVTRAADICEIPTSGNIPAGPFTLAVQVNAPWLGKTIPNFAPRICSIVGGAPDALFETTLYVDARFNTFGAANSVGSIVGGFVNGAAVVSVRNEIGLKSYVGGNKAVGTQAPGLRIGPSLFIGSQKGNTTRHFYGHVRNLRIWHLEATEDQIKPLK